MQELPHILETSWEQFDVKMVILHLQLQVIEKHIEEQPHTLDGLKIKRNLTYAASRLTEAVQEQLTHGKVFTYERNLQNNFKVKKIGFKF